MAEHGADVRARVQGSTVTRYEAAARLAARTMVGGTARCEGHSGQGAEDRGQRDGGRGHGAHKGKCAREQKAGEETMEFLLQRLRGEGKERKTTARARGALIYTPSPPRRLALQALLHAQVPLQSSPLCGIPTTSQSHLHSHSPSPHPATPHLVLLPSHSLSVAADDTPPGTPTSALNCPSPHPATHHPGSYPHLWPHPATSPSGPLPCREVGPSRSPSIAGRGRWPMVLRSIHVLRGRVTYCDRAVTAEDLNRIYMVGGVTR